MTLGGERTEWAWSDAPIVLPVSFESREWNAVFVAFYLAEYSGSTLLITHVHDGAEKHPFEEGFRQDVAELAREVNVKYEYVTVEPRKIPPSIDEIARCIVKTVVDSKSQAIVMSAHREAFFRELFGRVSDHVARLSNRMVVLVETPQLGVRIPKNPKRIFIPVLRDVHPDPFIIAAALTSSASVPDVEIVAAKIVQLPRTVPLDALEMESRFNKDEKEFSFLTTQAIRSLGRPVAPIFFPVREIGEDIPNYLKAKGIDVVVMYSKKQTGFYSFLTKNEYDIVSNAPCVVLVVLPGS
jgi:nucleotide-binding universal stress UspA family protein